jgi:hypothetical protein
MEFASEMVVKATLMGQKITEVPTTLSPDGRSRPPHLRSWRDGWRHLRFLLCYSPRWLFLIPGIASMVLGLVVMLAILPGAFGVGGLVLDVNTLMYAAAAIFIGFQSVLFAVFTKIYGMQEGLLPEDDRMKTLFRFVTLESGIIVGIALVVLGLAGSIWAVSDWGAASFAELDPKQSLRVVVPSVVALTLGFQIMLSSFFLSILGMSRARG